MFKLANHDFEVTRADLVPFVSDDEKRLCWGVELAAQGAGDLADWQPELTAERLVTIPVGSIRHWQEIAPIGGRWTLPSRNPEASLYVFEHSPIYDCAWALKRIGTHVSLRLEGRADIDNDRIAVTIDLPVQIAPWPFGKITERECRAMYERTGLRDDVDFREVRGVAHLVFRPTS